MSNSGSLFCPEVTASLGSQWMGTIRLAQPASVSLIAIVAMLIVAALLPTSFLAALPKKRRVTGATVVDVSRTPFAPAELPPHLASTILSNAQQTINGFNSSEVLYRIKVKLKEQSIEAYRQKQTIKPGMTLEADVLQGKRKIWEWVLMAQHT